jgi:ribosomal protein S18 acetylase RimI-like enzyme
MLPTLRAAEVADAEALLEMMRDLYEVLGTPFDPARSRPTLLALLRDPALGRAWLVHEGAAVVGYAVLTFAYSLEFHGRVGVLDELYVKEGCRGRGVGSAVLRLLEAACPALGVRALALEVARADARAQAVYRKAGFAERPNHAMVKRLPEG